MSAGRRILVLVFGACLIGVGLYVLALALAHPNVFSLARGAFGAMFLIGLGGFLLWDDVVRPLVRRR